MKRIDEKVAISGDGAELIQSYLNELNMKLLAVGLTESYSIVMEAETLFISDINELNKTTKVTVFEVQKIIEKHGTPDEIVLRYLKASMEEQEDAFFSMNPETKELIKRSSTLNKDFGKAKLIAQKSLGIASLIVPPYLLFLALLQLNQYEGNFVLIVWFLEFFSISDDKVQPFIVIGFLIIIAIEGLTSYTGKLVISLRNTIRFRTLNRSIIATGAFASFILKNLYENQPWFDQSWFDRDNLNYNETTVNLWIFAFFATEITFLIRDHLSSFYPLQPRFTPIEIFVKLPYILFVISIIFALISLSEYNRISASVCLIMIILATFVSGMKKYHLGLRFYSILIVIPMLLARGYEFSRPIIYLEMILVISLNLRKYKSEIKKITDKTINLAK